LHRQHIATLRHDRIDAPCVLDGPINSESSKGYIEHFLVPTLKPGDIVIMDNLGSHKGHAVRRAIRSVGARLLFLLPYSSDLEPIGGCQAENVAPKGPPSELSKYLAAHRSPTHVNQHRSGTLGKRHRAFAALSATCDSASDSSPYLL
jgi:DDE superfamily endonuclease